MDQSEADNIIGDVLQSARSIASAKARGLSSEEVAQLGKTVCDALKGGRENFMSALAIAVVPKIERQGRRVAVIMKPFIYVQRKKKRSFAVLAPPEYETDFASIPKAVQGMISSFGRHAEAAVIHDWLYAIGTPGDEKERKQADRIFLEAMKYLGVGYAHRSAMYRAVRMGGKDAFGRIGELKFRELTSLKDQPDTVGKKNWRKFTTCWHEGK